VKLVHEVKQEVCSRDEARHSEKSNQWFSEKRWVDEQVWQRRRNEYYYQFILFAFVDF